MVHQTHLGAHEPCAPYPVVKADDVEATVLRPAGLRDGSPGSQRGGRPRQAPHTCTPFHRRGGASGNQLEKRAKPKGFCGPRPFESKVATQSRCVIRPRKSVGVMAERL